MEQEFDDAQQQRNQAQEEQKINNKLSLEVNSNEIYTTLSLLYNSEQSRPNADLVCVVDISGSMASEATIQNSEGDTESKGLTILDIVKHAVKTIAANLQSNDRIAIVAFDDRAEIIQNLLRMDESGKKKAIDSVDSLADRGSTNLWDGVFTGLEVLRTQSEKGKNQAVLVFTDGMPNVVPPRGHIPMLRQYKEKYPDMKPIVHTFGFGYSMDSQLLDEIAQESSGIYAFIPDSQFVGTVFVNSLSNILPTMACNTQLNIELLNGAKATASTVLGNYQHLITSWGIQIELGTIQQGQSKDIALQLDIQDKNQPFALITVKYLDLMDNQNKEITREAIINNNNEQKIEIQRARLTIVETIKNVFDAMKNNDLQKSKQIIQEANKLINSLQFAKSNAYVLDLLQDLNGQITEASSRQDWYQKWGRHYLLSLMRAHLYQMCNNFKDPGVQHYGGKLFKQIRDAADEVFLKLPPPKPSRQAYVQKKGQYQKQSVQNQQVNMQSYYNARCVCFDGNCLIELQNGTKKKVKELQQGDIVKTQSNNGDKIKCIVKTICKNGVELIEFSTGLKITPYHPIFYNNCWTFPISVNNNSKFYESANVYSIVLENDYSLIVNGIECASLGHNQKIPVLIHPYFGSEKVVKDLMEMKGWERGNVLLETPCVVKNQVTGLIEKLVQTQIL